MQEHMIVNLSSLGTDSVFPAHSDIYKTYSPKGTVRNELCFLRQAILDRLTKIQILTFSCSVCTKDADVLSLNEKPKVSDCFLSHNQNFFSLAVLVKKVIWIF